MELNKAHIGTCKSETKYPIQLLNKPWPIEFSENVVNTFADGKKMVRGYIEAGSRDDQLILMACVEDKPGAFAKLCFLLANLSVTNPATAIPKNTLVPSFHNTQALSQRNDYFCFFSDADLIENEKMVRSNLIMLTIFERSLFRALIERIKNS